MFWRLAVFLVCIFYNDFLVPIMGCVLDHFLERKKWNVNINAIPCFVVIGASEVWGSIGFFPI